MAITLIDQRDSKKMITETATDHPDASKTMKETESQEEVVTRLIEGQNIETSMAQDIVPEETSEAVTSEATEEATEAAAEAEEEKEEEEVAENDHILT